MEEQPRFAADLGAAPALDALLARWRRTALADAAADQRRRQHWLERQDGADATFAGVLVELAERGRRVSLTTVSGQRLTGWLLAVGTDVVVLEDPTGTRSLVALRAVSAAGEVDPHGAGERLTGTAAATADTTLSEVLAELATERPEVSMSFGAQGAHLRGRLVSVGRDTAALRLDGAGGTAFVALANVEVCRLDR
ncbi:MAG: hypothetical protein KDB35_05260 [Acidimicrobiales bacterium]|nr:hypothetical protein [Acidimicrobiales bacterium]